MRFKSVQVNEEEGSMDLESMVSGHFHFISHFEILESRIVN